MPELPDLEVFRGNIFSQLSSKHLVKAQVYNSRKVFFSSEVSTSDFSDADLLSIERIGKELLFCFSDQKALSVHLMLNGEITISKREDTESIRFKIFALHFENESLVFSDRGGLCTVKYTPTFDDVPDALSAEMTLDYFKSKIRKKPRANIKAVLIDQKIIKGIGNAYADEILWHAKISPKSLAGKIPDEKIVALYDSISVVLKNAIQTIKELTPNRISGEERSFLSVHNKEIEETATGHRIQIEQIASKTTYFTDEQIEYR